MMIPKKKIYLFIYDGFADREVSHLLTCLVKCNRYIVKTIALDKVAKQSLSGLSVMPDFDFMPQVDLKDIDQFNTALIILPGGVAWEEKINSPISPLIKHCIREGITIAASGESTLLLADFGLLNKVQHTSINSNFLETFSFAYSGQEYFLNDASVYHQGVITANGLDPVDFANTALKVLSVNMEVERSFYEEVMFE